jgi:hypothetical protein
MLGLGSDAIASGAIIYLVDYIYFSKKELYTLIRTSRQVWGGCIFCVVEEL